MLFAVVIIQNLAAIMGKFYYGTPISTDHLS
jgi:hypothetical protein